MDSSRFDRRWLLRVPFGMAIAACLAYTAYVASGSPRELAAAADLWAYNGVVALAGLTCIARAYLSPALRWAWAAFGAGLLCWAAADFYWVLALSDLRRTPYPSWADAGYLAALPCFYVGVGFLIRQRVGHLTSASWLDGAIGVLAAAAAGTAILAPALVGLTKGDTAAVVTNMAYPLGDILLIAFIVGALAVGGVRKAGPLLVVGAGLAVGPWRIRSTSTRRRPAHTAEAGSTTRGSRERS